MSRAAWTASWMMRALRVRELAEENPRWKVSVEESYAASPEPAFESTTTPISRSMTRLAMAVRVRPVMVWPAWETLMRLTTGPERASTTSEVGGWIPRGRGNVNDARRVGGIEAVVLAVGGLGAAHVVLQVPVDFAGVAGAEVEFDEVPGVGSVVLGGEGEPVVAGFDLLRFGGEGWGELGGAGRGGHQDLGFGHNCNAAGAAGKGQKSDRWRERVCSARQQTGAPRARASREQERNVEQTRR